MTSQMTLPKLLAEKYASTPDKVALRQKDLGIWNELTWKDYYHEVEKWRLPWRNNSTCKKAIESH